MSMGHGSFSTTMKYYTGVPADLQNQAAEALGELLFGTQDGTYEDSTPVTLPSNPERLAELKAELQEKLLQIQCLRGALGRTRTWDLLIRSLRRVDRGCSPLPVDGGLNPHRDRLNRRRLARGCVRPLAGGSWPRWCSEWCSGWAGVLGLKIALAQGAARSTFFHAQGLATG